MGSLYYLFPLLLSCFILHSGAQSVQVNSAAGSATLLNIIGKNPIVRPGNQITIYFWGTYQGATIPTGTPITVSIVNNSIGWTPASFVWESTLTSGNAFSFEQALTAPQNVGVETIYWSAAASGINLGVITSTFVEISCSDGIPCNGDELFINGACTSPTVSFCDFGTSCSTTNCDNDLGLCHVTLNDATCDQCNKNCEYLGCDGKQCGTDGCGGNCGSCADGHYCDSAGQCIVVSTPGVCTNPIQLFANEKNLTGVHYFTGNTSTGYHRHVISCNYASTSPELVYTFTVPDGQTYGFDFRSYGFDTVMDVRKDGCEGEFIGCNDDGTPPAGYGSRVARMISAGKYYVIIKGYSVDIQGEFTLYMSFQPECIPKCNSQFCGSDECGGTCGTCGDSTHCSDNFKCVPDYCTPDCSGNECGFDGCGGYCGNCTDGKLCNLENGLCQVFTECDGLNPVCSGCTGTQFCASDCTCYAADAPLPDLYVERERLAADITFDADIFKESSCAYREGCIAGTGKRRLLRFSVLTTNQGRAAAILPTPPSRPDLFSYSPCHGHYHFNDYAYYALLTRNGSSVVEQGRKQGYCVLDGSRRTNGSVDCIGTYTCDSQGISVGWADTYTYDLDCQWIDITNVAPGDYLLYVELNRMRKIAESDYSNNKAWVEVTIPVWQQDSDDDENNSASVPVLSFAFILACTLLSLLW